MTNLDIGFEAIGTWWHIQAARSTYIELDQLTRRILETIEDFDQVYSRFRPDSYVSSMAEESGRYVVPDTSQSLMAFYELLHDLSSGLFTPTIAHTLIDAGYDATYSLQPKTSIQAAPNFAEVVQYSHPILTTTQPTWLDFGAAGKGYLLDIVMEFLISAGFSECVLDAGGDIVTHDLQKPLRVGLEHPLDATKAIGIVELQNQAIAASAGNRRAWGKYHHIMHPTTKDSINTVAATWVVAPSGMIADGLATALFLVPASKLQSLYEFQYALVRSDLTLETSNCFPGEFFLH